MLMDELGPRNAIDVLAGTALLVGQADADFGLMLQAKYLAELSLEHAYNSEQFCLVLAAARDLKAQLTGRRVGSWRRLPGYSNETTFAVTVHAEHNGVTISVGAAHGDCCPLPAALFESVLEQLLHETHAVYVGTDRQDTYDLYDLYELPDGSEAWSCLHDHEACGCYGLSARFELSDGQLARLLNSLPQMDETG